LLSVGAACRPRPYRRAAGFGQRNWQHDTEAANANG